MIGSSHDAMSIDARRLERKRLAVPCSDPGGEVRAVRRDWE
jgi:hypothetical protein